VGVRRGAARSLNGRTPQIGLFNRDIRCESHLVLEVKFLLKW
jgi:hypothetical protein